MRCSNLVLFLIGLFALIMTSCASSETPTLFKHIITDNAPGVISYLQSGSSPDVRDERGNPALVLAVSFKRKRLVELLLNAGANTAATNASGMTALMVAAGKGEDALLRVLLAAGAEVDIANTHNGRTALILAARNGHEDAVSTLLAANANPDLQDQAGRTALQWAEENGHSATAARLRQSGPFPGAAESPISAGDKPAGNGRFAEIWKDTYPKLVETLTLKDEHDNLPESSWFSRDKGDNEEDINDLLLEALELLGISDIQAEMEVMRKAREDIKALRRDISDYQTRKIGNPDKAQKYAEKIEGVRQQIIELETSIENKKNAMTVQLQEMGLNISREQVDVLLAGISGSDMVQMTVVFNNVKNFSNQLATLMLNNNEDLDFAKKHYGMYALLIEILIRMQQNFLDNVEQKYLPGIDKISGKTQALVNETQGMLSFETAEYRRKALKQSLDSQKLTLKTVNVYSSLLKKQAQQVERARAALEKDLDVALIRYHTVKLSGELVNLIQASSNQFHALANLQLPEIMPFESLQMKSEFEKLTAELQNFEGR